MLLPAGQGAFSQTYGQLGDQQPVAKGDGAFVGQQSPGLQATSACVGCLVPHTLSQHVQERLLCSKPVCLALASCTPHKDIMPACDCCLACPEAHDGGRYT